MNKGKSYVYLYVTLGVVLVISISAYLIIDFSGNNNGTMKRERTKIGSTTFQLLDVAHCSSKCSDISLCDNYYLISASTTDEKILYQFMREFESQNGCPTWILFQTDTTISPNWKKMIRDRPDKVIYPRSGFTLGFNWQNSFTLTDLANGKANGKYRKYDTKGKLFIEQEIVNNSFEGKRTVYYQKYKVEQVYKDNTLISEDTIK